MTGARQWALFTFATAFSLFVLILWNTNAYAVPNFTFWNWPQITKPWAIVERVNFSILRWPSFESDSRKGSFVGVSITKDIKPRIINYNGNADKLWLRAPLRYFIGNEKITYGKDRINVLFGMNINPRHIGPSWVYFAGNMRFVFRKIMYLGDENKVASRGLPMVHKNDLDQRHSLLCNKVNSSGINADIRAHLFSANVSGNFVGFVGEPNSTQQQVSAQTRQAELQQGAIENPFREASSRLLGAKVLGFVIIFVGWIVGFGETIYRLWERSADAKRDGKMVKSVWLGGLGFAAIPAYLASLIWFTLWWWNS